MFFSMTFTDPNYQKKRDIAPHDGRIVEKKNTWEDWHLVPTSRPSFSFPEEKTNYVEVPGSNNSIDLTESLTGYPSFKDRTGEFEFIIMHEGLDTSLGEPVGYNSSFNKTWTAIYSEMGNFLHGQRMYLEYEDDPGWYYIGRFTFDDWNTGDAYSTIKIKYTVHPFKYSLISSEDLWKWDPFNFRTGVIRTYKDLEYTTDGKQFMFVGTQVPVVPTIHVDTETTLTLQNGKTFTLHAGENKNPLIVVYPSENYWTFTAKSGTGHVGIYFRERSI